MFVVSINILVYVANSVNQIQLSAAELSWIRYENASCLPPNFVAIGDAVMRANPVFGSVIF